MADTAVVFRTGSINAPARRIDRTRSCDTLTVVIARRCDYGLLCDADQSVQLLQQGRIALIVVTVRRRDIA